MRARAPLIDPAAPRRGVNLSLNSDLVRKARAEQLNLSAIAEEAIGRAIAERAAARWREEIGRGVAQHEALLAEFGSFADAVRADAACRNDDHDAAGAAR